MLPVGALLVFLKQYIIRQLAGPNLVPWDEVADSDLEDEDDDQQEKEEKKSLKERLQTIQDVTQGVQNAIGKIASLLESVKKYVLIFYYLMFLRDFQTFTACSTLRCRTCLG